MRRNNSAILCDIKDLKNFITQDDSEFRITDWSNSVREDQSLSRQAHHALLTLNQRYPNIFPGLEHFMSDGKIKRKETAVEYLKYARESPYAFRSYVGGHGHGNDQYKFCYPRVRKNRTLDSEAESLSTKNPYSMSTEKPYPVESGKTVLQDTRQDTNFKIHRDKPKLEDLDFAQPASAASTGIRNNAESGKTVPKTKLSCGHEREGDYKFGERVFCRNCDGYKIFLGKR